MVLSVQSRPLFHLACIDQDICCLARLGRILLARLYSGPTARSCGAPHDLRTVPYRRIGGFSCWLRPPDHHYHHHHPHHPHHHRLFHHLRQALTTQFPLSGLFVHTITFGCNLFTSDTRFFTSVLFWRRVHTMAGGGCGFCIHRRRSRFALLTARDQVVFTSRHMYRVAWVWPLLGTAQCATDERGMHCSFGTRPCTAVKRQRGLARCADLQLSRQCSQQSTTWASRRRTGSRVRLAVPYHQLLIDITHSLITPSAATILWLYM
jgi:hypothetical protein